MDCLRFNRVPFVRCVYEFSEGWKEWVSPRFDREPSVEGDAGASPWAFSFLLTICRTGTGDGCMLLLEPRASDSKHINFTKQTL